MGSKLRANQEATHVRPLAFNRLFVDWLW